MTDELEWELAGLKQGDHLCSIHENDAEQLATAVLFIKVGLARGERSLCVGDDHKVAELVRALGAADVDVEHACGQGALRFLTTREPCLRTGKFDPHSMIEFFRGAAAEALADGISGLRIIGEMALALGVQADAERLIEYEALLNRFACSSRSVVVCQIVRSHFDPAIIHDVLRTHATVILAAQVCPNPGYEPPELLFGGEPQVRSDVKAQRVDWWIAQLLRARERKRKVDKLEAERVRLEAILHQMVAGVAIFDAHSGKLLLGNAQLERIFRSPLIDLANRREDRKDNASGEDDLPYEALERAAARSLRTGEQVLDEETDIRRGDGSRGTVHFSSTPIRDRTGRITDTVVIVHDASEQKQAFKQVIAAQERLRTLSRQLLEIQETERRHLARELHDEVGQMLTGLRMLLTSRSDVAVDAIKRRIEQALVMVDELLDKARRLSFDLRPPALDQLGLLPAVLTFFERSSDETGVRVDFRHYGLEKRFGHDVETTAYRIIQESLTNVVRHAGVTEATVRIWATNDVLSLQIEDRGHGFDLEAVLVAPQSTGLAGMQERVKLLGGVLRIESSPGNGTQIAAELPFDRSGPD